MPLFELFSIGGLDTLAAILTIYSLELTQARVHPGTLEYMT